MAHEILEKPCLKINEDVKLDRKNNLTLLKEAILTSNGESEMSSFYELFWGEIRPSSFDSTTFQDFNEIRTRCLAEGSLFEDPEFPSPDFESVVWRRPGDLCRDPKLFVDGISRFDVQQGGLGDCWFLAAAANLTQNKTLFLQVVPMDQSFDKGEYAGVFHFRFWQYGKWVDVVIDDRLPTNRNNGKLLFGHSPEKNEFWCPLLEKAYAKLYGSYNALIGGEISTALVDFTGGVSESYTFAAMPSNLYTMLLKAYERNSLIGCYTAPDPIIKEARTPAGIVRGHAYSVTKVQYVTMECYNIKFKIELLRLRNPWGTEFEWNGAWSDKSKEWNSIPDSEKEKMGLVFENDGEFWISYQDLCRHFTGVEICNLDPKSLEPDSLTWEMSLFEGQWIRGMNAGGCINYLETFWMNPQYVITLTDVDDDDGEDKCTVIVALMQKHHRSLAFEKLHIGFAMYRLPEYENVPQPLNEMYFHRYRAAERTPNFVNAREVSKRFKLYPGRYVIIPSTFEPDQEAEFILRVFSENNNNMAEYGRKTSLTDLNDEMKVPLIHE